MRAPTRALMGAMNTSDYFDGPFRLERPEGTLVYLDWDGNVEWEGPRVRQDMPLPPDQEWGRWWRNHPLSWELRVNLEAGLTLETAADLAGVPVSVARLVSGGVRA